MGTLTEDMGRLRDEIEAERLARKTLSSYKRHVVTAVAPAFIGDLKARIETLPVAYREAGASRNRSLVQLRGTVVERQRQTVTLVNDCIMIGLLLSCRLFYELYVVFMHQ